MTRHILIGAAIAFLAALPSAGLAQPANSEIAQGKALVAANGCAGCHTAPDGKTLAGGQVLAGWNVPGLDGSRRTGLGTWSVQDIVTYLKTGRNARAAAAGPMASVIAGTSKLSDADLTAMAAYLKSLKPAPGNALRPVSPRDPAMVAGKAIYTEECAACHTASGAGQPGLFPALRQSPQVQADNPATLLHVVLGGSNTAATLAAPTASAMPAFGRLLTDADVAHVLTYIRNTWGNAAAPVSAKAVADARKTLNPS